MLSLLATDKRLVLLHGAILADPLSFALLAHLCTHRAVLAAIDIHVIFTVKIELIFFKYINF
jgi:hypothetical protein